MRSGHRIKPLLKCLVLGCVCSCVTLSAQELSPRAFWPAPTGTSALVLGHAYSFGDTIIDPSLPIDGVDSDINTTLLGYGQTLDLFGRTANLTVELPYVDGTTTASSLDNRKVSGDFSGLGDLATTISVNFIGAPAMDKQAFADFRRDPGAMLGASLRVLAPTGEYDDKRLLNAGANRWAGKLELGIILPLDNYWLFEAEAGVWEFGDNDSFLGQRRQQKRLRSLELHLVRRIQPGFWASLSGNYYQGGTTKVGDDLKDDLKRNWTAGGTLVFPFASKQAVKIGLSTGKTVGAGQQFNQIVVSYTRVL